MRNYLFEINTQNAYTLAEKYNLSEYDRDYIFHNFWPVIKVINYDTKTIKEKLSTLKNEFIKDNTIFDLEIFNRENTDLLVYELNQYIDVLKRGKVEIWEEYGDDFFYIFKMESDIKENTLFISDKNITQIEIYFKNILDIITNQNKSESLQKPDSKITDSQYKNYVKSIKDYILNENKNSIESFKFEQINPLKYLSKDEQLKKLDELINKFYEILNVGYPFVAYNFVNNVFDEENFFSNIPLSIIGNKGIINVDNLKSNKEIKEFISDYARAKYLELLFSERELVLNPVTEPIKFLTFQEDELPIMDNLEIANGIFQADVRKGIRIHIQVKHEIGFESFLKANYLSDETYYIDLIYKQNEVIIEEYEKIVNFNDISQGEEITDEIKEQWYEEKVTRDHYWYYKEYQSFLEERLTELKKLKIKQNLQPQQPELLNSTETGYRTTKANEYVLLIINSYFDAQESLGNDPELIDLVKDLFLQTIKRAGKIQERENLMTNYEYNSRICFAFEAMKEYGYYDYLDEHDNANFMRIEELVKDIKKPISMIEFVTLGNWIDEVISTTQPQQAKKLEPLDLPDSSAVEKEKIVIKELHPEMFLNNGFRLFEHILKEYIKPKNTTGRYEDLSFHYRCMFEDNYIHQKPEPFKIWFIKKYTDDFSKVKTKTQTTNPQRKKDYSTALDWFKSQE